VAAAGAVAPEVGIAVDLTGAADCEVLDPVGVTDTVDVPAPAGEVTGLVATGLGCAAVTVGDAWSSGGAVDRLSELALAVGAA
jgi:hypothetical protein